MRFPPHEPWFVYYLPDKGWCMIAAYGKGENGYYKATQQSRISNKELGNVPDSGASRVRPR